jgi:outer membrane biosynthesis protein TonB
MRLGIPISVALHIALGIGGVTIAPALMTEAEPVPIFDIELVTISEVTNLKPAAAEEVVKEEEVKPEEPPPAPEPEVPVPEEAAPPPPPKEEPKPAPKKEKEPDFDDELKKLLASANSSPAPAKKEEKPNPFKNANRGRTSVGTGDADTVTIQHYIMRQILDNGCWGKQTDLADSHAMSATIRVRFGQDGHFSEEPKLVEPSRMPSGGPYLVYVTRAMAGLNKCNGKGFKVPPEYFTVMKSPTIDLRFQPGAD